MPSSTRPNRSSLLRPSVVDRVLGSASASQRGSWLVSLAIVLVLLVGGAVAQDAPEATAEPGAGPIGLENVDPAALADEAVQAWLDSQSRTLSQLSAQDAETICLELPRLFAAPPPPEGTTVELDDRQEREAEGDDRKRFTYAAEIPPDRLDVVEVIVVRAQDDEEAGVWTVDRVGFQLPPTNGRSWLQSRQAGWGFAIVTLLFVVSLFRPSPMRRWLALGRESIMTHRRIVIGTMIAGWTIVGFGLWSGSQLPDACEEAVLTILGATLDQVGANQALASGDVARTALVIFYQNFMVVTLTALFGSALLLGVPAYLLAGISFLAQATAFGVIGVGGFPQVLLVLVLFVLEFTAYFLVVSGGGMLVATLARGGFGQIGVGYRKLVSMLPWAALLLVIGAWYEAAILLL